MGMIDGSTLAREAQLEGLVNTRCFRCGRDPEIAHNHNNFFCPAFADYSEVGRWISTDSILAALRKVHPKFRVNFSSRMEETEGPGGQFHRCIGLLDFDYDPDFGIGREQKQRKLYLGRFDHPQMPEFSLWEGHEPYTMLYKGWRTAIREFLKTTKTWESRGIVENSLSVDLAPSTEDILRGKIGFL